MQPVLSPPMTPPRLDGAAVVGDHGHLGIERVALAVERRELLAAPRAAHREIAVELVGVEDVERPVEIEGEEIGDVDQRRDRPQPDRLRAGPAASAGSAPFLTPRMSRPRNSGQALSSGPARCTAIGHGKLARHRREMSSGCKWPRPAAARSRAMPRTPRQSARLGVTLMSSTGSSRPMRRGEGAADRAARRAAR